MAMLAMAALPVEVKVELKGAAVVEGLTCTVEAIARDPASGRVAVTLTLQKNGERRTVTWAAAGPPSSINLQGLRVSLVGVAQPPETASVVTLRVESAARVEFAALGYDQKIAWAKATAEKTLGAVEWSDDPRIRILHNRTSGRVELSSRVNLGSEDRFISVTVGPDATTVVPAKLTPLPPEARGVAALFGAGVTLQLTDQPEAYEVTVTHPAVNGSSGGAERYRVDKKTFTKTLLWHERFSREAPEPPPLDDHDFVEEYREPRSP